MGVTVRNVARQRSGSPRFTSILFTGVAPLLPLYHIPIRGRAIQVVNATPPPCETIPDPIPPGATSIVRPLLPGAAADWHEWLAMVHLNYNIAPGTTDNVLQAEQTLFVIYGPSSFRVVQEFNELWIEPVQVLGLVQPSTFQLIIEHETESEVK